MSHLTAWFDAVTDAVLALDPDAFEHVDLKQADEELERLTKLVAQIGPEPFSVRDNRGGSGQSDSS